MKRKIISLIVTGALLLSTTGTAFAKEEVVVPFSGDGAEQSEEVDDEEIVDPFSGEGLEWGEEVENDGMAEPFSAEEIEQDPEVENDEVMPKEVTEDISEIDEATVDIFSENTELNAFINSTSLIQRVFGANRIKTSVELSKYLREKSDVVILADSENYPDALSGSTLTKGMYPILLVNKSLSPEVIDEIKRLETKQVMILGGYSAIPESVEQKLIDEGILKENIVRLAGETRYETSFEIIQHSLKENLVFVSGDNFPDALASAAFAKSVNANVVLLGKEFTEEHKSLVKNSYVNYIIGGPSAVDPDMIPAKTTVIAGENRYETSALVADSLREDFIIMASGENFPDALSLSPLSMGLGAPVILTKGESLHPDTIGYLKTNRDSIKKVLVVGGEKAISPLVYKNIQEIIETGEIQTFPPKDVSVFQNNNYVMALKDTKLSGNIYVPKGKILKVISIKGETVELEYAGSRGIAIVEDYGKNNIIDKNTYIPYISQVEPVYAPVGCEPVSLLMGLKGKGYAQSVTTRQFLDNMPKHPSNPRKGFVGSPYTPNENLRTTINPAPLAEYGARYGNVSNMEGKSMDDIIMELDNGNPVVVYVTLYWESAFYKDYKIEGKTETWLRNNHAVLLTGYNKTTKEFYVSDPYNRKKGSSKTYPNYKYMKSRSIVEPLYNIRKFAVVVR